MLTESRSEASPSLFAPVGKQRMFESVLDQLETLIHEGRLRPGDRLPGERALAETLQVSRPSLREALRVLEGMDIVTVRTGIGPAGGTIINDRVGPTVSRLMRLYMALGHFEPEEVVDLVTILARPAARKAAESRTDAQLQHLEQLLGELEQSSTNRSAFLELETQFQVALASASGNRLLAHLMGAMRATAALQRQQKPSDTQSWIDYASSACANYRSIVDAVRDHDLDAAETALSRHLDMQID